MFVRVLYATEFYMLHQAQTLEMEMSNHSELQAHD